MNVEFDWGEPDADACPLKIADVTDVTDDDIPGESSLAEYGTELSPPERRPSVEATSR